jgi:DNA-binding MarR family transcriptional regulator
MGHIGELFDTFRPRRKIKLGTRCTYALTPLGKTKAEEFAATGPAWDVLAYLDENHQSTIADISEGTRHKEDRVKEVLKRLISSGYVKRVVTEV